MTSDNDQGEGPASCRSKTSDAVTAWVVEGESSAAVTRSSARQLERDTLTEIIVRMEAQHGPVDQSEVDEIAARLVDR